MNLMALTLVGLASMPRLLTMKLSSFSGRDTKHTLGRVELVITFCLDDDVIDIGLGVAPDLPLEASPNGLLVGGASILEVEHHGVVAVSPEGGDEGCLLLI